MFELFKALGKDGKEYVGYYERFERDGKIVHVIVNPDFKHSALGLLPVTHEIEPKTLKRIREE